MKFFIKDFFILYAVYLFYLKLHKSKFKISNQSRRSKRNCLSKELLPNIILN